LTRQRTREEAVTQRTSPPYRADHVGSLLRPQCGFSSTVEGNVLSYDQEVAKLRLIVETAREVWG
jgi:hypothetical protein